MEPIGIMTSIIIYALSQDIKHNKEALIKAEASQSHMMSDIEDLRKQNEELEKNFNGLFADYLKLGSSHAATSARDVVNDETLKREIDIIILELKNQEQKLNYINDKVDIYHP